MTDAFVLGGVRTAVGRYGGSLSHMRTDDLLGRTMVAACEQVGVPLERIEDIVAGCVNPAEKLAALPPQPNTTQMTAGARERFDLTMDPLDEAVDHVRGSPGGRLIVEYGDYECPPSVGIRSCAGGCRWWGRPPEADRGGR
jgi:hypothetical protein